MFIDREMDKEHVAYTHTHRHTQTQTHTHTHTHTVEYYSAIKRSKTGSFVETWMSLESSYRVK